MTGDLKWEVTAFQFREGKEGQVLSVTLDFRIIFSKELGRAWKATSSVPIHRNFLNYLDLNNCRIYKSPALDSILSQMNPLHDFMSCLFRKYAYFILFTPRPFKFSLPLRLSKRSLCALLSPHVPHFALISTSLTWLLEYNVGTSIGRRAPE